MNLIGSISGSPEPSRVTGMLGHKDRVKFAHRISEGVSSFEMAVPREQFDPGLTSDYFFFFAKKGEKMYIGYSGDFIRSYTLSTPFDVSTATYDNVQWNHSSIESSAESATMSPDGRYLYLAGQSEDTILMFTMSTPYDITTAQLGYHPREVNNVHSIGSLADTSRSGFRFGDSGNKFYITGSTSERLEQFSLSTAYDITSYTHDGYLLLSTYGIGDTKNVIWNNNGTKFFILDDSGNHVNEFSVSNAWDVTSGTITELNELDIGTQETTPEDIAFNSDGTKMFIAGSSGDDINVYDLSTGFDTSTSSFDTNYNVAATSVRSLEFSSDGTKLMVADSGLDYIYYYTLSTAFDLSTLSTATIIDMGPSEYPTVSLSNALRSPFIGNIRSTRYNGDGSSIIVMDTDTSYDKLFEFKLLSPFDTSKIVMGYVDAGSQGSNYPADIEFSPDGTRVFILDGTDDRLYAWDLDYPFIVSPNLMTINSISALLNHEGETAQRGFALAPNGTGFYACGDGGNSVYFYDFLNNYEPMFTAFRDKGATDVSQYGLGENVPREVNVTFTDSGEFKLFIYGSGGGIIRCFNLLV